jgi:predicted amidophosphoribosyltransferase
MDDLFGKGVARARSPLARVETARELPQRPTRIDARTRASHSLLEADDLVYYLGEYASGAGPSTPMNDLIHNFKIKPSSLRGSPVRRRHKERAIAEVGAVLAKHLSGLPPGVLLVPIPTSKLATDPDYDDRLLRALKVCKAHPALEVRQLIKQKRSTAADHEAPGRQSLRHLLANCYVDETLCQPRPAVIILFDDVLTQGKHFKVCQRLLGEHYGEVPVIGFFLARALERSPPDRPGRHPYDRKEIRV